MRLNGENYRMEIFNKTSTMLTGEKVLILYRGNRVIWTDTWGGQTDVRRLWWPYSDDAFEIKEASYAGSWNHSQIYRVNGDEVIGPLIDLPKDTPGGPIFRDMDGDGRAEMLYDNYDWYVHHEIGPDKFMVFKVTRDLRIKLWKTLPNPKHTRLPYWSPNNTITELNMIEMSKLNLRGQADLFEASP